VETPDLADAINANLDGWNRAMGVRFTRATADEVVATWTVGPEHRQAYGLVHGGVHCGVIETVASVGAALDAMTRGQTAVGLENHTSFLRAVREGDLEVTARPLVKGSRTQVWEAHVRDANGRLVATGRVRLLCLDPGAALAGRTVTLDDG
jgi:uncharacterized protein (TIGR00369 family)